MNRISGTHRLLLVTLGELLGVPLAALAAVTATSTLSLGLRVAFLRRHRPPDSPAAATPATALPGRGATSSSALR